MKGLLIFVGVFTWLACSWGLWNDLALNKQNFKFWNILIPRMSVTRPSAKFFSRFQMVGLFWILIGLILSLVNYSSASPINRVLELFILFFLPLLVGVFSLNSRQ